MNQPEGGLQLLLLHNGWLPGGSPDDGAVFFPHRKKRKRRRPPHNPEQGPPVRLDLNGRAEESRGDPVVCSDRVKSFSKQANGGGIHTFPFLCFSTSPDKDPTRCCCVGSSSLFFSPD